MPYSSFKNLSEIEERFKVSVHSADSLFRETPDAIASQQLADILAENVSLALNINTEKARSELIIAPVLIEVRKLLKRRISFFSGLDFNVNEELGLSGYCDFILSNSPDQVFLEAPVVCVVEAKNETIKSGYAQCVAEMLAARIFNQRRGNSFERILGIVTTGSNWKFLWLEQDHVVIDFDEYLINQVNKILGIIVAAMTSQMSNQSAEML